MIKHFKRLVAGGLVILALVIFLYLFMIGGWALYNVVGMLSPWAVLAIPVIVLAYCLGALVDEVIQ
jgi:hypothetical protein